MLEREVKNMYGTESYCLHRIAFFQFTQLYSYTFIATQESKNGVFRLNQIKPKCTFLIDLYTYIKYRLHFRQYSLPTQ